MLSGVRRTASCLFADIRGFTRFAASADPARVVTLLDHFFASACRIALEHGGSIDKLIGDAIMVLFGIPERRSDDRRRALAAAISMIEAFDASIASVMAADSRRRRPRLGLGAGIATGPVILANVGSTVRMDYTVVGATVNVAARLCAEARSREVLCDAATARAGAALRPSIRVLRLSGVRGVVRAASFTVKVRRDDGGPRDAVDPVCGMKVAAASSHEWEHRGDVYRFCSRGCRARFVRNPRRFLGVASARR